MKPSNGMSPQEHMDLLMEAYDKSEAQNKLMRKYFGLNDDSTLDDLSFGDIWSLGEQLVAIQWGLT